MVQPESTQPESKVPDLSWEEALHLIELYCYRATADYNIIVFWTSKGTFMKFQLADTLNLLTQATLLIDRTRKGFSDSMGISPTDENLEWKYAMVYDSLDRKQTLLKSQSAHFSLMLKTAQEAEKKLEKEGK